MATAHRGEAAAASDLRPQRSRAGRGAREAVEGALSAARSAFRRWLQAPRPVGRCRPVPRARRAVPDALNPARRGTPPVVPVRLRLVLPEADLVPVEPIKAARSGVVVLEPLARSVTGADTGVGADWAIPMRVGCAGLGGQGRARARTGGDRNGHGGRSGRRQRGDWRSGGIVAGGDWPSDRWDRSLRRSPGENRRRFVATG